MNQSQYQILIAAMALGEFTNRELAERADVNFYTVKSCIERSDYFEKTNQFRPSRIKGGRRAQIWTLEKDSKEDIASLVNGLWDQFRPKFITQKDAAAAYADSEARDRIRMHLALAGKHKDDQSRENELEKAKWWFAKEEKFHKRWTKDGHPPPKALEREVKALKQHLNAFHLRIDRMRYDSRVQSLAQTASWMTHGLEHWFENQSASAFDPLLFAPARSFEEQMEIAINTVEKLAELPKCHLVLALVICLGRFDAGQQRTAICNTLVQIGFDTVAESLGSKFDATPTNREASNLRQVLAGLCVFPRMVQQGEVGIWLDSHAYSNLFTDNLAAFYIDLAQHRPGVVRSRIIQEKSYALSRLEKLVCSDPQYWENFDVDNKHNKGKECYQQALRWRDEYLMPVRRQGDQEDTSLFFSDNEKEFNNFIARLTGQSFFGPGSSLQH